MSKSELGRDEIITDDNFYRDIIELAHEIKAKRGEPDETYDEYQRLKEVAQCS